jgi:2-keto-3-deoxy-L-fuconate dehydrogenase
MGAYSKSGASPISGIVKPGDVPPAGGLYLLDIVPDGEPRFGFPNISDNAEIVELIACGAHLTLFTTGRGSVVGSAISPVIKVCANPETARRPFEDAPGVDVHVGGEAAYGVGGARAPRVHPHLQGVRADRAGVPAGARGMSGRLAGKVALVTAAGQGIGRATAELFAAEGATVHAVDLDEAALASLPDCTPHRADLTDAAAIAALPARIGPVDVLFNCAGFVHSGTILECDERDWAFANALNVTAMYRTIRAFLPAMVERRSGSIINMSSIASSVKGIPNRFAYGATKAAVIGLTKSVAADFVAHGVRCNAICPGTVDTPSLQQRLRDTGDYDAAHAAFIARQPMGRLGRPEEIAALALYLASDESAFTTGAIHIVDGGWIN